MINNSGLEHTFIGRVLLVVGAVTAATGVTLSHIDLMLSICLRFVSFTSFFCYLLINQDQISAGWDKAISKIKSKLKK